MARTGKTGRVSGPHTGRKEKRKEKGGWLGFWPMANIVNRKPFLISNLFTDCKLNSSQIKFIHRMNSISKIKYKSIHQYKRKIMQWHENATNNYINPELILII
jgi:hypothetical protein